MTDQITLRFWRKNSWPQSIDTPHPQDADIEEWIINKDDNDLFIGNDGALYYNMQCGHGTYIPLKIESLPPICPQICEDCGIYVADYPSKKCTGCNAYQEHLDYL